MFQWLSFPQMAVLLLVVRTLFSVFAHLEASDRTVRIWDPETGVLLKTLDCGYGINDIVWGGDALQPLLACASDDHNILVWDVNEGKVVMTLRGHTGHVFCLKINKTSNLLYSGSYDKTIRIWSMKGEPTIPL